MSYSRRSFVAAAMALPVSMEVFAQDISGATVLIPGTNTVRAERDRWAATVNVKDFGAVGDGIHDDSSAIAAAIAHCAANYTELFFPPGVYAHGSTLNFAVTGLRVDFGGALLKHTGAGCAVSIDSGPDSDDGKVYNIIFRNLRIQGNPATTDGLLLRGAHHLLLDSVKVHDVSQAAIRCQWVVGAQINSFVCSVNESPFAVQPAYGIVLDQRGEGYYCTNVTCISPAVEKVSASGIFLKRASHCNFIGGTSEGNARGIDDADQRNFGNVFQSMWFEENSISDADLYGSGYLFSNCYLGSSGARDPNVNCIFARRMQFTGGWIRSINLQSTSSGTILSAVSISNYPGLGIIGPGTRSLHDVSMVSSPDAA